MNTIRWGIVGTGRIANKFAKAIKQSEFCSLNAVASRSKESASQFAQQYQIPHWYENYTDLALSNQVDAVYISTPQGVHMENSILFLKNHVAVLCEKAVTTNEAEMLKIMRVARENNTFFMEAMWTRFLPANIALCRMLSEGVIGNVRSIYVPFGIPGGARRLFDPVLGGGALLGLTCYSIAFSSMIFGNYPKHVFSVANKGEVDVEETSILTYEGGKTAQLYNAINLSIHDTAIVYGEKGYITVPKFWSAQSFCIHLHDQAETPYDFPYLGEGFEHEINEVVHCLLNNKKESDTMPLETSRACMEISDRIRRCWQ